MAEAPTFHSATVTATVTAMEPLRHTRTYPSRYCQPLRIGGRCLRRPTTILRTACPLLLPCSSGSMQTTSLSGARRKPFRPLECHNAAHINVGAARHRLLLPGGYADRRGGEE